MLPATSDSVPQPGQDSRSNTAAAEGHERSHFRATAGSSGDSLLHVTLIDVPSLARRLAEPDPPTLIDVRFALGGPPGHPAYLDGHIPGAAYLDVESELCGSPGPAGRHPLPDLGVLQAALRRVGVRDGHDVVAYDGGDGQAAARLWWTLCWVGHRAASVLDGGFAAWTAQGRPVEPGEAEPRPGDITVRPGGMPVLTAEGAAELARTGVLLDARIGPRHRGETEPIDPVAGHIPGSVNLPAAEISQPDGRLRSGDELREVFARAGAGDRAGAYCGSGLTAAKTVLALAEAGFEDPALYVGSWSNWVSDPARPVATGEGT
jgi:thiosulfate/3-mercaptopyruvate sulfurtransferase